MRIGKAQGQRVNLSEFTTWFESEESAMVNIESQRWIDARKHPSLFGCGVEVDETNLGGNERTSTMTA